MKGEIRIGTSGWHYPHWRGAVYPVDLRAADWLAWYAERFNAVEINNTFSVIGAGTRTRCVKFSPATAPHSASMSWRASRRRRW